MATQGIDKELLLIALERELYKRDFFEFVKFVATILEPTTRWDWNFHHQYICQQLQKETERIKAGLPRTKHLIINVPFRSSKSLICSICYPIWNFIVHPQMSHINLSYSDNLSTDHSNKVVSIIGHPKFSRLFKLEFHGEQRGKTDFKLTTGGSRLSGGIGGTVLGRGADIIIMDDPNNTKRLSGVERHNTIKSWKDTISTRLNDPVVGLFIVIQQRLHQNDLSGYLQEKEPENWNVICLPAEAGSNVNPSYLKELYVNDLLWGTRLNREVLNNFKVVMGSIAYSQQLNQLTSPEEGNIIKADWLDTIEYEQFLAIVSNPTWHLFIDSAQTEKKKNDPTGILICCVHNKTLYVRKAIQKYLKFPDLINELKTIMTTYGSHGSKMYVEPKSNGKDIVNQLKAITNFNVIELPSPNTDKETRLNAVSPKIESKRLILIEDISNDLIIDELTQFPNAAHDEFCDLVGYAITKLLGSGGGLFSYSM